MIEQPKRDTELRKGIKNGCTLQTAKGTQKQQTIIPRVRTINERYRRNYKHTTVQYNNEHILQQRKVSASMRRCHREFLGSKEHEPE